MIIRRPFRLLVAGLILLVAALLLHGYVTDDTFIHLRYAENLLQRGEFAFNPGERSYGATSPLWVGGLVVLLKVGWSPLLAAWVLGLATGVLALLLLDALLAEFPLSDIWRAVILWLAAGDAWFLRWTLSGMETPLATAALLLLLWPLLGRSTAPVAWPRYFAWGVAAGLAGLVRPEFILLAPAALPWLLWANRRRHEGVDRATGPRLLAAAGGWLLALGPWLVVSIRVFGRLLPETATAKSYGLTFAPAIVSGSVARSLIQLAATQGILWITLLCLAAGVWVMRRRSKTDGPGSVTATWSEGGSGNAGEGPTSANTRAGWAVVGIVVTWTLLLVGGYAVKQVWVISRYLSPLTPVWLLALAFLASSLYRRAAADSTWRKTVTALLVCGCAMSFAANGWLLVNKVRPHARSFSRGVRECYLDLGTWLRENTPPDAVVAALDIGAVGYASERRMLDLMGLVSPEILTVGRQLGFEAMVASGAWLEVTVPDYLVDRTEGESRWSGRELAGVRFELKKTCVIQGVGLRESQPWFVSLYHLTPVPDS
jgi:hypothetical protein